MYVILSEVFPDCNDEERDGDAQGKYWLVSVDFKQSYYAYLLYRFFVLKNVNR